MKNRSSRSHRTAIFLAFTFFFALSGIIFSALLLFGDTLFVRTSIGTVPRLEGKPISEAKLLDTTLFQKITVEQYSDLPGGTIIAQDPPAGSRRKAMPGKHFVTITLYVSRGPAVTDVASVIGLSEEQARAILQAHRTATESNYVYHSTPAGTVLKQEPEAGSTVRRGDPVYLTVSRGPLLREVTLPDLRGLSAVEAESLLGAVGLYVQSILKKEDILFERNRVLTQDPLPGTKLPMKSGVTLIVAAPPNESSNNEIETGQNDPPDTPTPETSDADTESSEEESFPDGTTAEETLSPEDLFRSILDKIEQQFH